jgi:predicted enzyme related to lactoylglutathione lyase
MVWCDLTVENADDVRDFYAQVTGWQFTRHEMGEYEDYCMNPPGDDAPVAGICHAQGPNANVPPQWLIYITVENVEASIGRCVDLGGKIVDGPRTIGDKPFCVIQDPAGAVLAIIEA